MTKVITWVDLQGRYRVTSPAYNDRANVGMTEDELIDKVINNPMNGLKIRYGLPDNHVFHLVEDADQQTRLDELQGQYFRYGGIPDAKGNRNGRDGAWEMDTDGTPKINMPKARGVHMDCIRVCRNAELGKLDLPSLRAMEAGDTSAQAMIATEKQVLRDIPQTFDLTTDTPEELKNKWPDELPR